VEDAEFVAMLVDEGRIAARLNHPNVVQTVEVGEVDGQYFIAMEFLEGQPLHSIQSRAQKGSGGLPTQLHYRILADMLGGLHHAHELADYDGTPLEIVHRDISPHNIFVTYDGVSKVVDFGIAKASGRSIETRTGVVKGKLTYMAPEQVMGNPVDRRADIFSVGVMLWELAAGRRMWKGLQDLTVMHRLITGDIPSSPRAVNPSVHEQLDRICVRALAVRPDDRYQTALELQTDLDQLMETIGIQVSHRDVGRFVSTLYADKREEIRKLVERKLSDVGPASLPVIIVEPVSVSNPSLSTVAQSQREPPSTQGVVAQPEPKPARRAERRRGRMSAVFWVGVTLVACSVVAISLAEGRARGSLPMVRKLPVAAFSIVSPSEPELVSVTLRANPPEARFSIDGGPLLGNPYTAQLPKDELQHRIRIEAPGYLLRTRAVPFSKDLVIDLTLERAPEPSTERTPNASKAHADAPLPLPKPVASSKPKRPIDTDDPWH